MLWLTISENAGKYANMPDFFATTALKKFYFSSLALKLKGEIAGRAKQRQKDAGKTHGRGHEKLEQNSAQPIRKSQTRDELARIAGVSHDTIHKVGKIEALADDKTKEMLNFTV